MSNITQTATLFFQRIFATATRWHCTATQWSHCCRWHCQSCTSNWIYARRCLHVECPVSILLLFFLLALKFSHTNFTCFCSCLSSLRQTSFGLRIYPTHAVTTNDVQYVRCASKFAQKARVNMGKQNEKNRTKNKNELIVFKINE